MFLLGNVVKIRQLLIGLFSIFLFATVKLPAQAILQHMPVQTAIETQGISIKARCEGSTVRVLIMRVYFKTPQQQSYRFVDMQQDADGWIGQIPSRFVQGNQVHYFISALLDNQTIITYPVRNPYNKPQAITLSPAPKPAEPAALPEVAPQQQQTQPNVPEEQTLLLIEKTPLVAEQQPLPADTVITPTVEQPLTTAIAQDSSAQLLILTPETHETLAATEVVLAVSFMADSTELDTNSVHIFLDGNEVSQPVVKSGALITYEPGKLKSGTHWFKILAKDNKGSSLQPAVVSFEVVSGEEKKSLLTNFQGHVFSELRHEEFFHQKNEIGMIGADLSGQYGVLQFSGNFFLTTLESKKYQPRNRYSFSLGTPWAGISGGDVYPQMNELILWGRRLRGASGYLHLGFFNIDAVYGESNRAVKNSETIVDDGTGQLLKQPNYDGVFRQTVLGIRPSFGSGRKFQLGLSLVKIKDDTSSIRYGFLPKDNIIFGPDIMVALDRNRIRFEGAAAYSLITNNITPGATTSDELEHVFGSVKLPFDPKNFEKLLIVNDSTTPLNPAEFGSLAYKFQLRLNYWNNLLTIGYKTIGAEYISLGNPWLRTNIRGLYFSDRLRLFKNKFYFTFGYEAMADNFSKRDKNPVINLSTLNGAATFYPGGKWPTVNVNLKNHDRNNNYKSIDTTTLFIGKGSLEIPDTTIIRDSRERQLYRDFSVQINQNFYLWHMKNLAYVSYILSQNIDKLKNSRLPTTMPQGMENNILSFSVTTEYQFPLKTTFTITNNKNRVSSFQTIKFLSASLGGEYILLNNKLTLYTEGRMTLISNWGNSGESQMRRNQIRLGASWQIAARNSLNADINLMSNSGDLSTTNKNAYRDFMVRLRYDLYF